MNKVIDDIVNSIIENGLSERNAILGCSDEEIQEIEDFYNIKLPDVYYDFLKKMGKSAGAFMAGTDMFYHHLLDLREGAIELLQDSGTDYTLPDEMFVFSMHQGYEFCCFDVTDSCDPKIYQYIEDDNEPSIVWKSFSRYLKEMLQNHLSLYC